MLRGVFLLLGKQSDTRQVVIFRPINQMKWPNVNMTDLDMTACANKVQTVVIWLTPLQSLLTHHHCLGLSTEHCMSYSLRNYIYSP